MISALPYAPDLKHQWDDFLTKATNATLLHNRDYMDYHSDRFEDSSLLFIDEKKNIVGLFPACRSINDEKEIISHQGLTYGGIVVASHTHVSWIEEMLHKAIDYYKTQLNAHTIVVKPIPQIYSSHLSEEQLYILYRLGAKLTERNLSQAINLSLPIRKNTLRCRALKKALNNNLSVIEANERKGWDSFHTLLTEVLYSYHATQPVHTKDELWLLHSRFPSKIKLFIARHDEDVVAGSIIYVSNNVVHTQYLGASVEGRQLHALDLVINEVIEYSKTTTAKFLDFGISTERDGTLNYGLALQKEGFDAHGVCYDTYTLNI